MLPEFTDWWLSQMRGLVPPGILPASMHSDARIIAIDPLDAAADGRPSGTIFMRRNGQETLIAPLDLDRPTPFAHPGLPTGLRLPPEQMLCREVRLPLAAARDVETVIGFEMDRLTPFTADELFWDIRGLKQDRTHNRLSVNLFLVLRSQIDPLLPILRRVGLGPSFIECETGAGETGRIDLASEHRPAARWTQTSLAALCGALALACVISPFLRQQLALHRATEEIAAIAPQAELAQKLRQQLEIAASGQAAIADARRGGDALQVLAGLTDALPDGTWLNDLALKSGQLTFDGRSTNAAALIGRLSAEPGFKNPSFTAPVTRTADGSADQFSIGVTVQE